MITIGELAPELRDWARTLLETGLDAEVLAVLRQVRTLSGLEALDWEARGYTAGALRETVDRLAAQRRVLLAPLATAAYRLDVRLVRAEECRQPLDHAAPSLTELGKRLILSLATGVVPESWPPLLQDWARITLFHTPPLTVLGLAKSLAPVFDLLGVIRLVVQLEHAGALSSREVACARGELRLSLVPGQALAAGRPLSGGSARRSAVRR